MDELEKTLDRVLSDPAQMEKLSRLAGELFGGETPQPSALPAAAEGLVGQLKGLMGGSGSGGDKTALLNALAPFLREDRREKLQKAMRLARAAKIAGVALREAGGENGAL